MYIEVEIILENSLLKDLDVPSEILAKMLINVDSIDAVRQDVSDDGDLLDDECILYLRCGMIYTIKYSFEKLKHILDVNKTI